MELLDQELLVLQDQSFDVSQVMSGQAAVSRQADGFQPKFTFTVRRSDMDVSWLVRFIRVKVESKETNPQDARHDRMT